jgi:hypothetical protein
MTLLSMVLAFGTSAKASQTQIGEKGASSAPINAA